MERASLRIRCRTSSNHCQYFLREPGPQVGGRRPDDVLVVVCVEVSLVEVILTAGPEHLSAEGTGKPRFEIDPMLMLREVRNYDLCFPDLSEHAVADVLVHKNVLHRNRSVPAFLHCRPDAICIHFWFYAERHRDEAATKYRTAARRPPEGRPTFGRERIAGARSLDESLILSVFGDITQFAAVQGVDDRVITFRVEVNDLSWPRAFVSNVGKELLDVLRNGSILVFARQNVEILSGKSKRCSRHLKRMPSRRLQEHGLHGTCVEICFERHMVETAPLAVKEIDFT